MSKLEKVKMYVVMLVDGDEDKIIKVIDEETWNWVTSSNPGQPPDFEPAKFGYFWYDLLVPTSQLDKIKKKYPINFDGMSDEERLEYSYDYEHPQLTTGSWENDRLILCEPADGYGDYYSTIREAAKAIKKNGHNFADEIHGVIY